MLLGNKTTPLGARLATTTPRSGDDANLGNNVTPLSACSVTMAPSSETLGNNTKLGNDSTLMTTMPRLAMTPCLSATTPSLSCKPYDATIGNNATLGDGNVKLGNNTTPLLTMTVMTTMTMAAVAVAAAVARTTKTAAVTYRQQSTKRDGQSTIN